MSLFNVYYFATILFVLTIFQLQFEIIKTHGDKESIEDTSRRLTLEKDINQSGQLGQTSSEEDDEESQESTVKPLFLQRSNLISASVESINVSSILSFSSFKYKKYWNFLLIFFYF
jgi:hypothetical protein